MLTGCGDASSVSVPTTDSTSQESSEVMAALQIDSTSMPNEVKPSESPEPTPPSDTSQVETPVAPDVTTASPEPPEPTLQPTPEPTPFIPLRDNTPYCPTPVASGVVTYGNDMTTIDASNLDQGYIMANYTGTCPKVKLLITGPNSYKSTYDLNTAAFQAFPLTGGDGSYEVTVCENIQGSEYSVCYKLSLEVSLPDPFSPYLYPNCYVDYSADSKAVELSAQLCETAANDLDCVSNVYNYIIENISYDYDKAAKITSGVLSTYIADIDGTLSSGKGICLDYAALMTCMLRSQGIPTRLEVGYASTEYHAWISTYINDVGWVNGVVEFDGRSWSLMDPTFAVSSTEKELKEFIGDGSNYSVKHIY